MPSGDLITTDDLSLGIRYVIFRKCTPAWRMWENTLDGINLTWLVQGAARYRIGGKPVDVEAGDLLVLPRGSVREAVTFPDRLMHCFSVDFVLKNAANQEIPPPLPFKSHPGHHEDILHLFHELSFSWVHKQPGFMINSKGLFLQILYRFMEILVYKTSSYTGDYRISRVISFVAAHYQDRITVKMMADLVNLNPVYFGTLFKQTMGLSFNQYLMQTRVINAHHMLSSGEYKVSDVAELCGFTDNSHFYKQFKELKGFAPSHCIPKKILEDRN